jgi:hypothetical protein
VRILSKIFDHVVLMLMMLLLRFYLLILFLFIISHDLHLVLEFLKVIDVDYHLPLFTSFSHLVCLLLCKRNKPHPFSVFSIYLNYYSNSIVSLKKLFLGEYFSDDVIIDVNFSFFIIFLCIHYAGIQFLKYTSRFLLYKNNIKTINSHLK